jgi:hypothetical protein
MFADGFKGLSIEKGEEQGYKFKVFTNYVQVRREPS